MKEMMDAFKVEQTMEYDKWVTEIPGLRFDVDWIIKIIPPFGGAIIRFRVGLRSIDKVSVSVYLDCYDNLGFFGEPYWGLYPYDDDVFRVKMNDTGELIQRIRESIRMQIFGSME